MSDSTSATNEHWLTGRSLAWAIYDFATSVWTITVISRYFPIWAKESLGGEDWHIVMANAVSLVIAFLFELLLTPLSDATGRRRIFVTLFTLTTVGSTLLLGTLPPLWGALALFALGNMGLNVAATFYNAMLRDVSTPRTIDRVSAVGVALAEVGIVTGLIAASLYSGDRKFNLVFWSTAIILLVFASPLMLFVRERRNGGGVSYHEARARAWADLKRLTLFVIQVRWLRLFFLSFMFSAGAVAAVGLFMVPYAKEIIGLSEERRIWVMDELSFFLFVATSFSVIAALPSGAAATRWGDFRVLLWAAVVWGVAFLVVAVAESLWVFLVAGALVGAAYAAGRVATRAVLLKAVGAEDSSKIFAVLGVAFKIAVLGGTGLWAAVVAIAKAAQADDPPRYAVAAMFALMLVSIFLLRDAMREKRKAEVRAAE